jgi:hypothetical protein
MSYKRGLSGFGSAVFAVFAASAVLEMWDFPGRDAAICILVVALEPARRRIGDFIGGQNLVAIGIHQVEQGRGVELLQPPASAVEFIDRQFAVAIHVGGGDQPCLFGAKFGERDFAIAVGVEQVECL